MALFLKDQDVNMCLTMADMLAAIEGMQAHFGEGEAYNLARRKIIATGGLLSVMGGGLFYDNVMGVKTYTVVKGKYSFQVSLYDTDTGELLCYTQANRLGQLRTGATTGVAVKYLSKEDSSSVGLIGSGYQALTQLEAICQLRQIKQVRVYSRTAENRESFARTASDALAIEVKSVGTGEEATTDSDVVVAIAATMEPVLQGANLRSGATAIAAGPTTWRAREIDDEVLTRADKIFVDSLDQAPLEAGDMASAADRGILQWSQLQELRHAVAGKITGRDNSEQIIYAKMMGTGVADIAAAKLAYDRAKTAGLGMEMDW